MDHDGVLPKDDGAENAGIMRGGSNPCKSQNNENSRNFRDRIELVEKSPNPPVNLNRAADAVRGDRAAPPQRRVASAKTMPWPPPQVGS